MLCGADGLTVGAADVGTVSLLEVVEVVVVVDVVVWLFFEALSPHAASPKMVSTKAPAHIVRRPENGRLGL